MVPRIVILGAGYAGLECALTLSRQLTTGQAEVTLINRHDYHYASTLLHRVSMGTYSARKARVFLRNVLNPFSVHFVKDTITHIDLDKHELKGEVGTYGYDYLVLAAGFVGNTLDVPGVTEYAYQITSMNTAERLLAETERRFKDYTYHPDPDALRFVVVGTGFTGVEYAAEFVDRADELCRICGIDRSLAHITLIGRHRDILPMLGKRGARLAKQKLQELGVEFVIGSAVEVQKDGVIVEHDGEKTKVPAGVVVWAAGVKGSPLVAEAGLPQHNGRVAVDDRLRAPGYDDVYVIGDCACFTGKGKKKPYPPTGQIAQQMGAYVGHRLTRIVRERGRDRAFRYHYRGTACSLGHLYGIVHLGRATITGEPGAFMKNAIENKWMRNLGGTSLVMKKGQFRARTSD
jgi:NADH dehydrogenase